MVDQSVVDVEQEYQKIQDDNKAKSEALRELFDFDPKKLSQRTRLNLKQIHEFAKIKANMAVLKEEENRTWVECYMDFFMEMMISLGGEGRREGLQIFETQQNQSAYEESMKP